MNIIKAYDTLRKALRVIVGNSPQTHNSGPEEVVTTDKADGVVVRTVYSLDTLPRFSHQIIGVNAAGNVTTVTYWLSNDDSADDSADTGWIDFSTEIAGAASKELAASVITKVGVGYTTAFQRLMVKKVYALSAAADNQATEHFRAIY